MTQLSTTGQLYRRIGLPDSTMYAFSRVVAVHNRCHNPLWRMIGQMLADVCND